MGADLSPPSLAAFLDAAARRPFAWGDFDCLLWLADWGWVLTGRDPAHAVRGRYATELGAARVIARAGGVEALVGGLLEGVGLRRTDSPQAGAAGLVEAATAKGPGPVGAICTFAGPGAPRWAVLGKPGLVVAPFRVLAAWEA